MEFLLESDLRICGISYHKIKQVRDKIIFFLQALDGCISVRLTKKFHLRDDISEKTRQYRNKCTEFERYLQLSIR